MSSEHDVITICDEVELQQNLRGIIRFIGEIHQRKGIYYGIELFESKGKSNGSICDIRYFKCKIKRGLFVRRNRINRVFPQKSSNSLPHRIGINESIRIQINEQSVIGSVRYIGIPFKTKDIFYGLILNKPIGDSNGSFHGIRYFSTNTNCAYFIKANSKRIDFPLNAKATLKFKETPKRRVRKKYSMSTESESDSAIHSNDDDDDDGNVQDDGLRSVHCEQYYKNRANELIQSELQREKKMNKRHKSRDPFRYLSKEWIISAKRADSFKARYECTRSLMEKICSNGSKLPFALNENNHLMAAKILKIFANWLQIDSHVVVRKHILQMLVPFGNTAYPIGVWSNSWKDIAKSLMLTQWNETKRGYVPLVTPALIAGMFLF